MLTINLNAIQSNWLQLKSLASSAQIAAVIKANAYGLGAVRVGQALYAVGCREFFVATLDEALSARKFLPAEVTIYVLGGIRNGEERDFIEARLVPVLCSVSGIKNWAKINADMGLAMPSAIKVNTGMTRFGLDVDEFKVFCCDKNLIKTVNPVLLMSHLACADEPDHPLNESQLENFQSCVSLMRNVKPEIRCSLANSSGVFLGEQWHFDLVRPGAALYGIAPNTDITNPMKAVVKLTLPITQVRRLSEPASIGYGADAVLPKGARIAVVAGGYADGINHSLGRSPEGILDGQLVQSIGRVSMDATIFDISGISLSDEQLLQSNIEVINDERTLDYLSRKNKLLGYEILTSLGNRYPREYLSGVSHG